MLPTFRRGDSLLVDAVTQNIKLKSCVYFVKMEDTVIPHRV
jgi:signal peptidase I